MKRASLPRLYPIKAVPLVSGQVPKMANQSKNMRVPTSSRLVGFLLRSRKKRTYREISHLTKYVYRITHDYIDYIEL